LQELRWCLHISEDLHKRELLRAQSDEALKRLRFAALGRGS